MTIIVINHHAGYVGYFGNVWEQDISSNSPTPVVQSFVVADGVFLKKVQAVFSRLTSPPHSKSFTIMAAFQERPDVRSGSEMHRSFALLLRTGGGSSCYL